MNSQNAIDALALQNQRFNDMLRDIDGGLWWASDAPAKLNADKIFAQADCIRIALDEVGRLVKKVAA